MKIDIEDGKLLRKYAKRLYLYLENSLDWTVGGVSRVCDCGKHIFDPDSHYCPECGTKLPKVKKIDEDSLLQLEEAIVHMLKGAK